MRICLDWKNLFSPSNGQFVVEGDNDKHIEHLKERYAEIFKPEVGTVKGVTAKLHLKDNVKPVFQKAHPVPYALRPALEKELKKMRASLSQWKLVIGPHPLSVYLRQMAQ